jgi:hypothetical protein
VNPDDTTEHYQGSKSIEVGSIGNYDYIQFEAGSGATFNVEDWENIIANLKLKANLDTRKSRLAVVFLLDDVAINNPTNFDITGNTTNWQNLVLPFSRINFFGTEFNQIRFYFYKTTGGAITGFYLDYIKLEIGIEQPVLNQSVILTGDITGSGVTGSPVHTTLATVNSNVGQFGDATNVPKITVDGKGRVTAIENVAVTIPPAITPTSDLTPVDTDEVVSLRGTSWLKTTWTVLKAFLKTYFDNVYSAINHAHTFLSLTDTPASYSGAGGKIVAVNSGASALEFIDAPSGGGDDEKVKYNADDDSSGYLAEKVVSGTGIALAEGTSGDADKLQVSLNATFLNLTDTPSAYTGLGEEVVSVKSTVDGLETTPVIDYDFSDLFITKFTDLTDTPSDLSILDGEVVVVNARGTALETDPTVEVGWAETTGHPVTTDTVLVLTFNGQAYQINVKKV